MPERSFFGPAVEQLREYDIALEERGEREPHGAVLDEAHLRLQQLEYLVQGIRDRVEERLKISERPLKLERLMREFATAFGHEPPHAADPRMMWTDEELARRAALAFEAELFTDAFYWVAWRLRDVVRRLPNLKNFDAVGIRTVRNHLVEHPEKNLSVTPVRDFVLSAAEGVVLRPDTVRKQDDDPIDEGLVANATELRDRLRDALKRAKDRGA